MASTDQQPLHKRGSINDPPPKQNSCTGFTICKLLVAIYGFFFLIIGLLLLGVGIWVEGVKEDYETINDVLSSPAILAIIVGIFMVITALAGIIGAVKENLILLKIFLAIVIIVFILQVIIGIVAFVYREETAAMAGHQLKFAIQKYHTREDLMEAVDAVQRKFQCCGLTGPKDWDENEEFSCLSAGPHQCSVPSSCCSNEETAGEECGHAIRTNNSHNLQLRKRGINTSGCTWFFLMWIENHLDIVGATALGFAIPQILGIFLVYTFIQKVEDRKHLFKYRKRAYETS